MKKRWMQIHLSTAIVLMLLASIAVYLNIRPTAVDLFDGRHFAYIRGYPFYAFVTDINLEPEWQVSWYELAKNVGCTVGVLIIVAVCLECFHRRRERHIQEPRSR